MPGDDSSGRPSRVRRLCSMKRVFNFSPGPAMLPEPVLRKAQAELLDWQGSGMSVMEVSHRGTDFVEFAAQLGAHAARAARRARRLQSAVPARRRDAAVRGRAAEPRAGRLRRRLRRHRQLGREGRAGGRALRARQRRGQQQASEVHDASPTRARGRSRATPRICTTRRTRPCSASSSTACPRSRTRRSSPTCRRRCCRARST